MPTVPVGEKIYPVMSTSPTIAVPAEGVTVPDTTGIFLAESLSPGRLQAAYTFSREDKGYLSHDGRNPERIPKHGD